MEGDRTENLADYSDEDPAMVKRLRPTYEHLAGEDDFISVKELLTLLEFISADVSEEKPDMSHAYALLALFDRDNSGKIDFHEFMNLYRFFVTCSDVFKQHSEGGRATPLELEKGLQTMKVRIPRKILAVAVDRYGDEESNVSFCDYMAIVCKIKSVMGICQEDRSGVPTAVIEKLLSTTLIM